ncbi:MAG: LysR family transcriptional regulator [Ruminococcus sp.]|nr:LysR family transcriptional regulator [Ruminococcus sp.]
MKIQQLEYVIAIAHAGSITAAAKNLFQAQPNISIALKELEAEIGMQIFWRTPNGMVLTPEGESFLIRAKDIVESMRSLEADYTNRGDEGVVLKVAAVRSAYVSVAIGTWVNELDRDEKISIHFWETNTNKVIEDVSSGKADVGIIRMPESQKHMYEEQFNNRKLSGREMCGFYMMPLMSAEHPLADRESVTLDDLKKYPEIVHADDEINLFDRTYIRSGYENSDADRRIFVRDNGSKVMLLNTIKDSYMWVSPSPRENYSPQFNMIVKNCSEVNIRTIDMAVCKKNSENGRVVKSFIDFITEFAESMTE